jgi:hypothetical protein
MQATWVLQVSIFMKEKDFLGLVWHKCFYRMHLFGICRHLMLILMLKSLDMRVFARTCLPAIHVL